MARATLRVAGYAGTPLARKLGYKPASRVFVAGAPDRYFDLLAPLPPALRFDDLPGGDTDLAHVFVTERDELARLLPALRAALSPMAALWVSWPKKASRVPTTVSEDLIRELALPLGLVDIKVCAVDEVWSALKLVRRRAQR